MSNPNAKGRPRVCDPWVNAWPKPNKHVDPVWFRGEVDKIRENHHIVQLTHKAIKRHIRNALKK